MSSHSMSLYFVTPYILTVLTLSIFTLYTIPIHCMYSNNLKLTLYFHILVFTQFLVSLHLPPTLSYLNVSKSHLFSQSLFSLSLSLQSVLHQYINLSVQQTTLDVLIKILSMPHTAMIVPLATLSVPITALSVSYSTDYATLSNQHVTADIWCFTHISPSV